jgi:hypothetical protein
MPLAAPLLQGESVILSASIPRKGSPFHRIEDASYVIEQAVVGLARAVLAHGGRLVFGAHPSISPLVASVASEYVLPGEEPRIIIYQSRAFSDVVPNETWSMHRLGYARIAWTNAVEGEHFRSGGDTSSCDKSLTLMRQRMIGEQRPHTMVVVGGMEGIFEEAELFGTYWQQERSAAEIYVAARTGGAAQQLVEERAKYPLLHLLEHEWSADTQLEIERKADSNDPRHRPAIPYAAMAHWLVRVIAERRRGR